MKNTDSILISQYQNGDEQALALLIEKHQKDLFSLSITKSWMRN